MSESSPSPPAPADASPPDVSTPSESDFWRKYGWRTTISLCVVIGTLGSSLFLVALIALPAPLVVGVFAQYVLLLAAPLLLVAGVTGMLLAVHGVVRHLLVD